MSSSTRARGVSSDSDSELPLDSARVLSHMTSLVYTDDTRLQYLTDMCAQPELSTAFSVTEFDAFKDWWRTTKRLTTTRATPDILDSVMRVPQTSAVDSSTNVLDTSTTVSALEIEDDVVEVKEEVWELAHLDIPEEAAWAFLDVYDELKFTIQNGPDTTTSATTIETLQWILSDRQMGHLGVFIYDARFSAETRSFGETHFASYVADMDTWWWTYGDLVTGAVVDAGRGRVESKMKEYEEILAQRLIRHHSMS